MHIFEIKQKYLILICIKFNELNNRLYIVGKLIVEFQALSLVTDLNIPVNYNWHPTLKKNILNYISKFEIFI